MRITDEFLESGRSRNGGWSEPQLRLVGVAWPPVKGWKRGVVGLDIPLADAAEFLRLKDAHLDDETPSLFGGEGGA